MPTVPVRCPHCGKPNLIPPAAAGTALRCPFCRSAYLAPPLPAAAGPVPPHLAQAATAIQQQPAARVGAASSEAAGSMPPHSPPRGRKVIAILFAVVFCTLLGILAVTAGALVVAFNRSRPEVDEVGSDVDGAQTASNSGQPVWTNAEQALVRDDARVRVVGIEYGPVLGRNANNEPIASGSGEFLLIYLQIENRGKRGLQYTSWYGAQFEEGGEKVAAELIDFNDRSWPLQRFPGVERIQGHTPQKVLLRGERAEDVLIFAGPETLLTGDRPLRLSLPAAAIARQFGPDWQAQSGFYRFEIPASMLSGEMTSED